MATPTPIYTAPVSSVKVSDFRTQQLEPSYLDITVLSGPSFGPVGSVYDGWCLDTRVALDSPANYVVSAYSTYETSTLSSAMPTLGNPGGFISNLDSINWLMGYYNPTTAQTYTYGDVQAAIWTMMGQDWHLGQDAALGAVNQTRITTLVNLALAHDGYVPDAGEAIGIVLDPVNAGGVHAQPIIIETKAAKLGDHVWSDTNANGLQDAGEPGIAGAPVQLGRDLNGDGVLGAGEVLASAVTDANGDYSFKGLTPGLNYQVQFGMPAGYAAASPRQVDGSATSGFNSDGSVSNVVVLAAGENNTSIDSGFYKLAAIGDKVWADSNANGIQDTSEAGVSGVTVNLCDANGVVVATKTTDGSGNYLFSGLKPGSYSVQFVAPANTQFTTKDANANASDALDSDADKTTGKTGNYTLASGEQNLTVDAGIVPAAKAHLGDFVFEDKTGNGLQDAGEPGIAGVTVTLCDANGNALGTTTTGTNGSYGFDVAPGTYAVKVTAPVGYFSTVKDANGNASDTVDSDIDAAGKSGLVTLASGQTNNTIDAGLVRKASLGDKVWLDANANGLQDNGEAPMPNVSVNLLDAAGNVVATKTTDANGNYLFDQLNPGTYSVKFNAPAGYFLNTKDANANASDALDSDADATTGKTGSYTLGSGDRNLTVDAGLYQKAHLGDFVFEDKNGNGIQDVGEPGIAGVTVTLCDANGNAVGTTATGANGLYGFDVAPGTYSVKVSAPTGYTPTVKDANGNASDSTDSDIDAAGKSGNVTLVSGQTDNSVDAGLIRKASLGDHVWLDANANGLQDTGEAPVANVSVNLLDAAGNVVATKTTNANGNYLFDQLNPGTYSVKFNAPAGYFLNTKDANANASDATDSDADATTGKTGSYTLASGDQNLTVDAGLYQKAHLGDFVFADTNANGIQNTGEPGMAGVTVTLCDASGNALGTTTTDANGLYGFDVAPGTYSVKVTAPAGYATTVKDGNGNASDATDSDIDASGKTGNVTLGSGQTNNTIDAGLVVAASIGDRVWLDANGDGMQGPGENGVANVTVNLINSAGAVVATQATNANGNYLFSVAPGTYSVQFVAPANYKFTAKDALFFADTTDSDADVTTGKTGSYTLAAGGQDLTVDAGLVLGPNIAHIGNYVWEDANIDGQQNANEAGVAGVSVSLLNSSGTVVATTTTSASGLYGFDVAPGTYAVKVAAPSGYVITSANQGGFFFDGIDSDIDTSGKTGNYTLVGGQVNNTVDAGLFRYASLGDRVWLDANANGLQDTGESGVANVKVNLYDASGAIVATKTTDANGNYLFSNLTPTLNYSVGVVAPTGYRLTASDIGTNDAVDSDVNRLSGKSGTYTPKSGESNLTVDAGLVPANGQAHIGDRVWFDGDSSVANGLQDANETTPYLGVVIELWNGAGTVKLATTTVDANGLYGFDVNPGTYRLRVYDWMSGVTPNLTIANVGTNDAIDSDFIQSTGFTAPFTVGTNEINLTFDAGVRNSPLALDLDHSGKIETVSLTGSTGAFDILGSGTAIQSGWISGNDGWLAVDRNHNGRVDSLSELFGGNKVGAGFAKLAEFDSNGDGQVDAKDANWSQLTVWRDANGNHQTDAGELLTLDQLGISSLGTAYKVAPQLDDAGNLHVEHGSASTADGGSMALIDVWVAVNAQDAKDAGVQLPTATDLLGDDHALDAVLGQSAAAPVQLPAADVPVDGLGEAAELIRRITSVSHDHVPFAVA